MHEKPSKGTGDVRGLRLGTGSYLPADTRVFLDGLSTTCVMSAAQDEFILDAMYHRF